MIISIVHDPQSRTLTITLPNKTIQLIYASLPPIWEQDPTLYVDFVKNYINGQIEVRTDRRVWLQSKDLSPNSPMPFTDSERLWYDDVADEVVFMEAVCTQVIWDVNREEYVLTIRNTDPNVARV